MQTLKNIWKSSILYLCCQILSILVGFLVSRSWTQLRYAWRAFRRLRPLRRHHFQWDVYVGYSEEDLPLACGTVRQALEERRGVSLMLPGRDDFPGAAHAEEIVRGVENSWKVGGCKRAQTGVGVGGGEILRL